MSWNTTDSERLIKALMTATGRPDIMRTFLDDLLTEREISDCVQRMTIAYWHSLQTPYSNIQKITGASSATIARIAKLYDKKGGFNAALKRINPRRPGYIN